MPKRRSATDKTNEKTLLTGKAANRLAQIDAVPLRLAAQKRYLEYSLSVITSRALPDVRDGLKPVQRRILYTMDQQGLRSTAKHRKCAKVVGDVMGNYHPHGDSSIYEALVRMAQPFSLRMPLIDGSGNFGSIDGDNAAAMRYTECRMRPIATEMLRDLSTRTVAFKPNYDGSREEPVVLPSRMPALLVNGATGIAVGMATNIPPHNLKEVCNALLKLLRDPEIKDDRLVAADAVMGPDFPTGGEVFNSREELKEIYATGTGSIKLRGVAAPVDDPDLGRVLRITEIPFGVNKSVMVDRIGELIQTGRLPLVEDVKDLSSEDIRVDVTLKKGADPAKVLAFLYKNTPLQTNFNVNLTCLIPTENPIIGSPLRLSLKDILWYFLHFRLEVLTARLENELSGLMSRIHILRGLALIFDVLDEVIAIIRASDGKADAATKIMARFPVDGEVEVKPKRGRRKVDEITGGLDAEQTDAILELKLYRLAKLEINLIRDELDAKLDRVMEIEDLLADDETGYQSSGRWSIIRSEIEDLITEHAKDADARRRTKISTSGTEMTYDEEDFIVSEDCHVLITRDGWIKRQKQIADPSKLRLRQGDTILNVTAGSTRASLAMFSNLGTCYTTRIADIPPSTGFGEPIQKLFKLKDGERIVAALSLDTRLVGDIGGEGDGEPPVHGFAATSDGYALRFSLATHAEPSTRSGRRFARVSDRCEIVDVQIVDGSETILAASANCRAIVCPAAEVNFVAGAGKGVQLIRLDAGDRLLGYKASVGDRDLLTVVTNRGAKKTISTVKYRVTSRGGRGTEIQKNGKIDAIEMPPVAAPPELDPA